MKCWLFLVMSLFCAPVVRGQNVEYQFRHLNVNDGLSHNQVTCFLKDKKGFLWIGTNAGLNRFDGYTVKTFLNDPENTYSLSNNAILNLLEAPDGRVLVFTAGGLNIFDPSLGQFTTDLNQLTKKLNLPDGNIASGFDDSSGLWLLHNTGGIVKFPSGSEPVLAVKYDPNNKESIVQNPISSAALDHHGMLWVIHSNGVFEKVQINSSTYKVIYRNDFLFQKNKRIFNYGITTDADGDLWIYLKDVPQGVYYFDSSKKEFTHLHQKSSEAKLNSDIVSGIVQANNGLMWATTDHGGVNIIDKKTFSVQYLLHRPEEEKSISQNSINTIYRDDQGIIWLGTFKKGVSYYHESLIRFPLYRHYPLSTSGLPFSDVNRFAEDDLGNLWIGTNGGGLIYFDRRNNTFKQYLHDPNDPNSLSSNVIVSLCIDYQKRLWIGTYFGGLNVFDGKRFTRYRQDPANPESIADENIWEIFEDSRKRLWIGTLNGGLDLYDRATNTFSHYRQNAVNSVQSNYISAITEDRKGNLWIGTSQGVDVLERETGRFFHFGSSDKTESKLSDNLVLDIREDSQGRIWIATRNGLNLFDDKTKGFRQFTSKNGLPHNTIFNILEDNQKHIWLSTANGLSCMFPAAGNNKEFEFRNYDESDGLQGKQFNENAALKTRSGELIFGGADGFNIFNPGELGINKNVPQVVLSDFQLHNKSVAIGEQVDGSVILPVAIAEAGKIVLPPDQNVFSIEFAGLNYFNPQKNQYKYILKGFHKDWITVDSRARTVTFTNLNPGEYTFLVKASNNDGYWNDKATSLGIVVTPPFWKTRTAFVLYCVIVISALMVTRKLIQKRERMKFDREQERKEAIRMHELDMMKIKFFTNVSHEFRTPLTLILTPLDKMLKQAKEPEQKQHYMLIQRNAKRLLNLVNQLLDFRKLEVQELKLNPSEGDIVRFIEETVYSFSDLSEKKDIKLEFHSSIKSLETVFDQDKIEKILFNLLSNAFKFTPEHGAVSVSVEVKENGMEKLLEMKVTDTGIGIEGSKLDRIFDRFFQNELPKSMVNQGSGIGLSITREFVKVHGGEITVSSEPGVGTCFTVTIPIIEVLHAPVYDRAEEEAQPQLVDEEEHTTGKPVLMLVEDNEDFRFYLKDNLRSHYRIVEAKNGSEAWRVALESLPDLIVSDIMMPEMNGIELCKKIRSDQRLSHTPVILLTARTAEEQKLEGFESGADDYITKPFNFEILSSRIKNLISKREKSHKVFHAQLDVKASELKITSMDEKFIQRAIKCVEDHIADPDFSVEALSHELGISRAHLYKKMMALTGKSPLEFIRMIRLQQAAQLLKKSQLTVAEVAYKVGFNNPKYFARYFRELYHVLPSVFAADGKKDG